ncbi:small nuclear ribonucleo protein U [Terfezia boudieri ATCC MYA-4762]|uniref:Small nuclear ribonucleo protein U n=1 Tax=Terfezia boudieri ATCC MYA-4762 TaxID=1051890 RepID=A0A3N4M2J0_9PEZI|nr:small nuclear ribonucleo protein U [Terfezia boudieri ATCC MYA-4762]
MASASPPPTLQAGAPNNTVYIRNLEESIAIPLLKTTLQSIFAQYGTIIDIVAKKNLRAKGQAFIVFDTTEAAEKAIREVQGFSLFEKPMVLQFARSKSDATVKLTGNDEELEAHKRRRVAEKERKQAQELEAQKSLKRAAATAPAAPAGTPVDGRPAKKVATGLKSTNAAAAPSIPDEYLPPNKVLFLQKLPADTNQEMLSGLFGRFDGFKEVRMVPGRKGIAFVEYEHQEGAISAKEAMAGAVLGTGTDPIKVTYQRQ